MPKKPITQLIDLDHFSLATLKTLKKDELLSLAEAIRKRILEVVSQNGGHLASNLGAVELTIALHRVFDSPLDKIIFDVSHQTYAHKILTGRGKDFPNLRKMNGLSGFAKKSESIHDIFEAGHSSTSLSAGLGFAIAKHQDASDIGEIVVVVGDASVANGLAFEALNFLGQNHQYKLIIIINDNEMSISKNIGSLGKTFNRIRVRRQSPNRPKFLGRFLNRFKMSVKSYVYDNQFFSSLGFQYFEGIDGHNIAQLETFFKYAKKAKHSVVLHVKTQKGKGYGFAEEDNTGIWHGVGPFDIASGIVKGHPNKKMYGEIIADYLMDKCRENPLITVITPAMALGSGLQQFKHRFPNRFIDVGIAEESAVVMASAMQQAGLMPIVFMYSTFLQRAYDQIVHDLARTKTPVVFCVDRSGIVPDDGDTHQGIYDIAFLSSIPHVTIAMPMDPQEAVSIMEVALNHQEGPFFLRYPKQSFVDLPPMQVKEITYGTWDIIFPLKPKTVVTYGPDVLGVKEALEQAGLKDSIGLINARFIKPVDYQMLKTIGQQNIHLFVYEQVIESSSLATMIKSAMPDISLTSIALPETFLDTGKVEELKALHHITYSDLIKVLKE